MKKSIYKLKSQESGLASIFVTLVMMVVIMLMVVGYIQLSNHEQSNSLDKQLSSAAYYAAESGVNEVKDVLSTSKYALPAKNMCGPAPSANPASIYKQSLSSSSVNLNVKITCLLVNPTPNNYNYPNVPAGQYAVTKLQDSGGSQISSINISWQSTSAPTSSTFSCFTPLSLPPSIPASCGAGIVRLDLVSSANIASASEQTIFIYPTTVSGNSTNNISGVNGSLIPAYCSTTVSATLPYYCNVNLTVSSDLTYYARLSPIYQEANFNVSIYTTSPTTPASLEGGEVEVDSTAQASNIVKRVREFISLVNDPTSTNNLNIPTPPPLNGISSNNSICKAFTFDGTNATDDSACQGLN